MGILELLVLVVMGFVFWAVVKHRAWWVLIGVVGVVVVLLLTAVLAPVVRKSVNVATSRGRDATALARMRESQIGATTSRGGAWLDSVDTTFDANTHASAVAAGRALGRQVVVEMIEGDIEWGLAKKTLVIGTDVSQEVLWAVVEAMGDVIEGQMHAGEHDPNTPREEDFKWIGVVPGDEEDGVKEILNVSRGHMAHRMDLRFGMQSVTQEKWGAVVRLSVESNIHDELGTDPTESVVESERSARVVARIARELDDMDSRAIGVDFVNKPWVGSFDSYASLHPQRQMVLARSGDLAASPEDAHAAAVESGAQELMRRMFGTPDRFDSSHVGLMKVREGIESGRLVTDRFVQQLSRPYGNVWREAMLVETDLAHLKKEVTAVMNTQARQTRVAVVRRHTSWASLAGGVLGVIVLVGGMYLVLSYATRGYYDWWLRLGVVVLGSVGVLFVVAIVSGAVWGR
jgi:hypothetical protein